jgi:hypothetical protein
MANAARIEAGEIQDHMPVIGSDGRPFGTVDKVEGEYIKLARSDDASGGRHRWVPLTLVAGLDGGQLRLSMPAAQAEEAALDTDEVMRRLALDPDAAAAFGQHTDDEPHGSRAQAHGGPKGQREHGQSGSISGNQGGPGGQTSFGVNTQRLK